MVLGHMGEGRVRSIGMRLACHGGLGASGPSAQHWHEQLQLDKTGAAACWRGGDQAGRAAGVLGFLTQKQGPVICYRYLSDNDIYNAQ